MDDETFRNWGYYEPSYKSHPCLQLMPSLADQDRKPYISGRDPSVMLNSNGYYHHPRDPMVSEPPPMLLRDTKPFISGRDHNNTVMVNSNGAYNPRDCMVSEAPLNLDCVRDSWIHRDKYLNMMPGNQNFSVLSEPSSSHYPMQMFQHQDASKDVSFGMEEQVMNGESNPLKKRPGGANPKAAPKPKKSKKGPSVPKDNGNASVRRVKPAKKNLELVINGIDMDISGIPIPVCSCTGSPQQCYRWGTGGWQSACCTTTISIYPLPMSTKRRGARIAGRKMSLGAFKKVLEKLSSEGYNFSNPIDLKTHWARHGTNKFVVIK